MLNQVGLISQHSSVHTLRLSRFNFWCFVYHICSESLVIFGA
jgi:hypothetical protein